MSFVVCAAQLEIPDDSARDLAAWPSPVRPRLTLDRAAGAASMTVPPG